MSGRHEQTFKPADSVNKQGTLSLSITSGILVGEEGAEGVIKRPPGNILFLCVDEISMPLDRWPRRSSAFLKFLLHFLGVKFGGRGGNNREWVEKAGNWYVLSASLCVLDGTL